MSLAPDVYVGGGPPVVVVGTGAPVCCTVVDGGLGYGAPGPVSCRLPTGLVGSGAMGCWDELPVGLVCSGAPGYGCGSGAGGRIATGSPLGPPGVICPCPDPGS